MNRRIIILAALVGTLLTSWTNFIDKDEKFPSEVVLKEYKLILGDTIEGDFGLISIRTESIKPIIDSNLKTILPDFNFYYLTIFNGSHWEYNNGDIQTIAAIPKSKRDSVRLLVPLDYSESAVNFTAIFLNKKITLDKENTCYAIADLFLKTKRINLDCCDKELKAKTHTNTWKGDTLVVTTEFVQHCCDSWIKTETSKMKDYQSSIRTKFVFNQNILVTINYDELKK